MITTVDQLCGGGAYPHEDCQEACTASVLIDAGKADTVRNIESFDFGDGDNPADGTGGQVIVDRLARSGIPAHLVRGVPSPMVSAGLARGLNRWFVAIYSNAAGTPYSGPDNTGHWLLVYAYDGVSFSVMQPIGGRLQTYTRSQLDDNAQDYNVQVDVPIGLSTPGDQMTPDERLDLGRALARLAYVSIRQRQPETQQVEDGWATEMRDRGFDPGMRDLTTALQKEDQK